VSVTDEPIASEPFMPGYLAPGTGGTLPWAWAEQRLVQCHTYWVGTCWPDGRPHLSPVWGVWFDACLWFSCDPSSRKAKNLTANRACAVATDNPLEPVVIDGVATRVEDRAVVTRYVEAERVKYSSEWNDDLFTVDFFAPGTYMVEAGSVIAVDEKDFPTSATKWSFIR
jgi:Pyridoxamine 5'-phosphate oxidase